MILKKFILLIIVTAAAFSVWFFFFSRPATHLESRLKEGEPVSVRLALINDADSDALEYLAQMIIFPDKNIVLFYFLNTDAKLDPDGTPVRRMSPDSADRFREFTGSRSDFYLTLTSGSLKKLFDLTEGAKIFQEKPLVFEGARYQYPAGALEMHGDHTVEYLLYRKKEPDIALQHLTGVDRIYRAESVLLNLIWRGADYYSRIKNQALWMFAVSLIRTDMEPAELKALAEFLTGPDIRSAVTEVPLSEVPGEKDRFGRPLKALMVSGDRAASHYESVTASIRDKSLFKAPFKTDILNGTETAGLARRAGQFISGQDIKVLSIDNYDPKPLKDSFIIDRSGNSVFSSRLLKITSLSPDRLYTVRAPSDVDATLLLGEDFNTKNLKPL